MVARQSSSDRKRVSAAPTPSSARHYDRHDNVRRDPRQDPERRPASASTITLEDIQATMATLQPQVDRHTRLACRDDGERRPRASAYVIRLTGPPADASDEDPPDTARALSIRVVPDPADDD